MVALGLLVVIDVVAFPVVLESRFGVLGLLVIVVVVVLDELLEVEF